MIDIFNLLSVILGAGGIVRWQGDRFGLPWDCARRIGDAGGWVGAQVMPDAFDFQLTFNRARSS